MNNPLRRLFGRAQRAPKLSTSGVAHDKIDEYVLNDLRSRSERFDRAIADPFTFAQDDGSMASYEHSEALKSDLFYALHTTRPDVAAKQADEVAPSAELNRQIMQSLLHNEEFLRTRAYTRGDKIQAGIAERAMENELESALREQEMRELADRSNEMDLQEQRLDDAQQQLDALREQAQQQLADSGPPLAQEIKDQMRDAAQAKSDARRELAQLIAAQDQANGDMAMAVAGAVQDAAEKGREAAHAFAELAGLDSEAHSRLAPDDAFALAEQWASQPDLRDLAARVGRFKRDFRSKAARQVVGGREERVGIELGNDLTRVLPSELMRLGHPILNVTFLKDYADRSLVQYETVGHEDAGLGPCVIALDLSSSMNTANRHLYAKAVTLAVLANVHRDRRTVGVVTFNGSVTGRWLFPARLPLDLKAVTEFATLAPAGGTAAQGAIQWAQQVTLREPDFKRADLILVTDGEDSGSHPDRIDASRALRDQLTANAIRVFGVTVSTGPTAYTDLMCDDQVSVFDLIDPSPATDRIAAAVAA